MNLYQALITVNVTAHDLSRIKELQMRLKDSSVSSVMTRVLDLACRVDHRDAWPLDDNVMAGPVDKEIVFGTELYLRHALESREISTGKSLRDLIMGAVHEMNILLDKKRDFLRELGIEAA